MYNALIRGLVCGPSNGSSATRRKSSGGKTFVRVRFSTAVIGDHVWSRSVYQSLTGSAKKTLGRITAIVDMWQRTVDESV
jgi:hypothetical protein